MNERVERLAKQIGCRMKPAGPCAQELAQRLAEKRLTESKERGVARRGDRRSRGELCA